jgi:hypothetical protein
MKASMRRVVLSILMGLVLSPFAASVSTACSTPNTLPIAGSWEPNAQVGVVTGGVPSAVAIAVDNWNQTFAAAGICRAPTLIISSPAGGPVITMSYIVIPNAPCPPPSQATCATRGVTQFQNATFSLGFLETVNININSSVTIAAAITEVAAHEIGHTFGLADCSGCALNSTVMVSNPANLPAGSTINTLIGTPGPTPCDLSEVLVFSPAICAHLRHLSRLTARQMMVDRNPSASRSVAAAPLL